MDKQQRDLTATPTTMTHNTLVKAERAEISKETRIIQVGLDVHVSSLETLQHCTLSLEGAVEHLQTISQNGVIEIVLLKTCNRFELYASTSQPEQATSVLLRLIETMLPQTDVSKSQVMIRRDADVVQHLISVTSGLESALVGEYDIVAQVRRAYEAAIQMEAVGTILGRLFQYAIQHSKLIRNILGISKAKRSVTDVGTQWVQEYYADKVNPVVAIVGVGETARQMVSHLKAYNAGEMFVLNRNIQRANMIVEEFGGQAVGLDALPALLSTIDLVVFATSSPTPLLLEEDMSVVSVERSLRPLVIVDFGMPRNVEASVSKFPWVRLLDMFSIVDLAIAQSGQRKDWKQQIADLLESAASEFFDWMSANSISPTFVKMTEVFEEAIITEMEHVQSLPEGSNDVNDDMQSFASHLSKKLLQPAIIGLKEIAVQESPNHAEDVAESLFLRKGKKRGRHEDRK